MLRVACSLHATRNTHFIESFAVGSPMDSLEQRQLYPRSHLFTVRLWVEEFGDGQGEVRMQVKHVLSGETRYFRAWPALVTYLAAKIKEPGSENDAHQS
jgi:hypothetical protein